MSYHRRPGRSSALRTFGMISIMLIVILGAILYVRTEWSFYWVWTGTVSLVTLILYGFDKTQAKRQGIRVPEITLHLMALSGGVLGAWLGRLIFRHKTKKRIFTIVLTGSTILHGVIGVYWLFFS